MKTELLVQMDGLAKSEDLVFVLAASNLPWYVIPSIGSLLSLYLAFCIIILRQYLVSMNEVKLWDDNCQTGSFSKQEYCSCIYYF